MGSAESQPFPGFDSARLSHAYIAPGSMAKMIAMAVVCCGSGARPCMSCPHCNKSSRGIHPDITVIDKPDKKREIVVDQIRELKKDVIVLPNESDKKAYVINNADLMNANAQNAFLRILEEPPAHAVFILQTDTPAELIPTVRSRCVEIKSRIYEPAPDTAVSGIANEFFSALRLGNASLVEFMFRLDSLERSQFTEFLTAARKKAAEELRANAHDQPESRYREILSRLERTLAKAGEYLDMNVSVGHISGMICASFIIT